ncbi:DNA adenine methylase [Helicobacter cetorum]|uniref:Site-specific DNA-methyltransferase (adenine-specific) n=1 Tax=Helicobacter cetorum (strain ATCC BAA-540 / CCUG 52418 / MIT 99-5656) TaxID=1163745 RepID=I0ES79_HELCM|nr:Dam family site-specific DNA-(adenine-N6)-methyltransferase [Helicobacter cetorum]AFI05798.1 DNA adenine methylase [Helicobacter cetorum MIT 99-5656]
MTKIFVPPIKSQGIKTKLVDWIKESSKKVKFERWVEPFMGTGVVAFNIQPQKALLCDNNPHLICFYKAIQDEKITPKIVRDFLNKEGLKLLQSNGEYYYEVRERFNKNHNSLDFLFLNRACFNGMIRFNQKGKFNVPFCKNPQRFAQSLVTKIVNQVENIAKIIKSNHYEFKCQDFQETLLETNQDDLIYADPPYIGRNTDYFDCWNEENEVILQQILSKSKHKFILSTWFSNKYRKNHYIFSIWKNYHIITKEHFYYVGAKENNRNIIYEALLSNVNISY